MVASAGDATNRRRRGGGYACCPIFFVSFPRVSCLYRVSRTTGTYEEDVSGPFFIVTPHSSPFFVGDIAFKLCGGS